MAGLMEGGVSLLYYRKDTKAVVCLVAVAH